MVQESQIMEMADMFGRSEESMTTDYRYRGLNETQARNRCLSHIQFILERNLRRLEEFGLPNPTDAVEYNPHEDDPDHVRPQHVYSPDTLNPDQHSIYVDILASVDTVQSGNTTGKHLYYIDGPDGSGKPFCITQYCLHYSEEVHLP